MARSRKKLGDILVGWGMISQAQADQASAAALSSGRRLGDVLVEMGFAKEDQVAKALANQFGMEFVDLSAQGVGSKVDMKLIARDLIKKHTILPFGKVGNKLQLVIHDPMDLELMDMLRFRYGMEIEPRLAAKGQIKAFIEGGGASGGGAQRQIAPGESLVSESIDRTIDRSVDRSMDKSIDVSREDAPVVRLVDRILREAIGMRASDIHFEPMADRVRLRYRIDGVCLERDNLPKRMQNAILSRIKLMSVMNIAEKRVPQDGRIKLPYEEKQIDFRVSACPAYHGESVVLRILRPESARIGLANLGFEGDNLAAFNRIIRRPNGIFLVTGPTGSGKTTTLYSALDVLNRPDKKIITAEDPVEYNFAGINQCQVKEQIGLGFSIILRSMLRQAPNIILVGEIRDREVGEIAIQAALTGHLVFSTLHTNDAPSAITRLIDMGIKPFLVASSIQAVMAQRLIRVICPQCKAPDPAPDPKLMHLVGLTPEMAAGKLMKGTGCANCANTGYRGRRAIFEMMQMNSQIRDLAFNKAPVSEIRKAAIASGMKTLVDDGRNKILAGNTTCDEVAKMAQQEH
ncbi:MAG: Flp pilus assembly complex ATPase component TadA [Phycisphaerales bacterium]|nr:Flp pilus assembly complex ATPase component TadA [Phycisphaerales bacterium]